jgi:hypothetical protein
VGSVAVPGADKEGGKILVGGGEFEMGLGLAGREDGKILVGGMFDKVLGLAILPRLAAVAVGEVEFAEFGFAELPVPPEPVMSGKACCIICSICVTSLSSLN